MQCSIHLNHDEVVRVEDVEDLTNTDIKPGTLGDRTHCVGGQWHSVRASSSSVYQVEGGGTSPTILTRSTHPSHERWCHHMIECYLYVYIDTSIVCPPCPATARAFPTRPFYAVLARFAASFASFSRRTMPASTPMPPNTRPTPSHCMPERRWPKATTDSIMVNILRVTVTVTRRTEEKVERVWTSGGDPDGSISKGGHEL